MLSKNRKPVPRMRSKDSFYSNDYLISEAKQPVYEKIETEVKLKDLDGKPTKYLTKKLVKTKKTHNIVKEINSYSPLTEYKSKVIWADGVGGKQNLTYVGEKKSHPQYVDHTQLQGSTLSQFTNKIKQGDRAQKTLTKATSTYNKSVYDAKKSKAEAEVKKSVKTKEESK